MFKNKREIDDLYALIESQHENSGSNDWLVGYSPFMNNIVKESMDVFDSSLQKIRDVFKEGEDITRQLVDTVQEEASRSPWKLLGTIAVGSFITGYLLGSSFGNQTEEDKL
jgi:hypothetical protein